MSSMICPSCNSPRIPRVLVPERTLFSAPTSRATVCISPRPRLTDSSCLETVSKEACKRVCKVFSSFSSTVWRICSKRCSFDSCKACSRWSVLSLLWRRFSFISCLTWVRPWCNSIRTSCKRSLIATSRFF